MASLKQTVVRRPILVLIGLHILIAAPLAAILSVWIDEGYSIHTTGQGFGYALHQAVFVELQPPLYFLLLTLWRTVCGSYIYLRMFSLLCTSLCVWLSAKLSRRYIPDLNPAWIAGAMAINPFLIWASVEIRVYALVILLTALLLLFFYDGYLAPVTRSAARWIYGVVACAALYTQYYIGFLLVANACALVLARRWGLLGKYVAAMIAVGALFSPMLLVLSDQVTEHTETVHGASSIKDGIRLVYTRVQEYAAPIYETADLSNLFSVHHELAFRLGERTTLVWIIARYGFAALLVFLLVAYRQSLDIHIATLFVIMLVCGAFYVGVLRITGDELLRPRHTASLFIPSMLLVYGILALTPDRARLRVLGGYASVYLLLTVAALYATYGHGEKLGDFKRVAAYLMAHERPDQPILVFHSEAEMPLSVHYHGLNALAPLPRAVSFDHYDLNGMAIHSEDEIRAALTAIPGHPQGMWLVTDRDPADCAYLGVELGCDVLEAYVNQHFVVTDDRAFEDSRVRFLQWKPGISL